MPAKVRPEHVEDARRALDALDDDQREAIRMMVEDAW
jgi:DNA-directed RNA polymerase specialized sigma24 family protein